jgi:hypothetical protein
LQSLSGPYAKEGAVGSFIILKSSRPAIFPASFVACLYESLKWDETVINACVMGHREYVFASAFSLAKIINEICSGENFSVLFPICDSVQASPLCPWTTLQGKFLPKAEFREVYVLSDALQKKLDSLDW